MSQSDQIQPAQPVASGMPSPLEAGERILRRIMDPEHATGGGAASAIAGAMGAALLALVARLSVGRQDLLASDDYFEEIERHAQALAGMLMAGSREDADAFDQVLAGFGMPKTTPEERKARSEHIQSSLVQATHVPLQNARACAAVLDLTLRLRNRCNKNLESDLECSQHLARAGFEGALSNARANLRNIKADSIRQDFERELEKVSRMVPG